MLKWWYAEPKYFWRFFFTLKHMCVCVSLEHPSQFGLSKKQTKASVQHMRSVQKIYMTEIIHDQRIYDMCLAKWSTLFGIMTPNTMGRFQFWNVLQALELDISENFPKIAYDVFKAKKSSRDWHHVKSHLIIQWRYMKAPKLSLFKKAHQSLETV